MPAPRAFALSAQPSGVVVTAVAYDRVHIPPTTPATAANTTAYAINNQASQLIAIGSINQTPNSPNAGATQLVGSLAITLAADTAGELNLDVSSGATAYLTANALGAGSGLYTVNLFTGAATLIGGLPAALDAFAVVPGSSVQFDATAATVAEGESASIAVGRTGAPGETMTVEYATADGTATGPDYTPTSGTLTFGPGETSKTIAVPTSEDTIDEPDETLTVTLSSPSPSPQPTAAPDVTAPTATLTGVAKTVTLANFLKGLRVASRRTSLRRSMPSCSPP